MTDRLAIALAQLNPTVGAVQANLAKARAARDDAAARGADLVLSRGKIVVDGDEWLGARGDGRFLKRQRSAYLK